VLKIATNVIYLSIHFKNNIMSVTRNILLKPFIKIRIQYKNYEHEIKTCGEHEELNENFYHYIENDEIYLFSNTKSKINIDTNENVFTTLTPELMNAMIAEFSEKHKEDILLLEAKINSKVKVEFGFVYDVR